MGWACGCSSSRAPRAAAAPWRTTAVAWHEAVTASRVRTLPATFLVGPDGQVRYSVIGELDWSTDQVVALVRRLLP